MHYLRSFGLAFAAGTVSIGPLDGRGRAAICRVLFSSNWSLYRGPIDDFAFTGRWVGANAIV